MDNDRITRLTATIQDVTGTDAGTAEWLAIGVFNMLAVMRLESQNKPVPAADQVSAAYRRAGEIVDDPDFSRAAFETELNRERPFEPGELVEYVSGWTRGRRDGWAPGIFARYPENTGPGSMLVRALDHSHVMRHTGEVRRIAPELISAARSWAADCQWAEDADDIANLSDAQIVAGVQQHYDGGWAQFVRDGS